MARPTEGQILLWHRVARGVSLGDLARKLGVSAVEVSDYERGKREPASWDHLHDTIDAMSRKLLDAFEEATRDIGEVREPDECDACDGYGHIRTDGSGTIDRRERKCLNCSGTGKQLVPRDGR